MRFEPSERPEHLSRRLEGQHEEENWHRGYPYWCASTCAASTGVRNWFAESRIDLEIAATGLPVNDGLLGCAVINALNQKEASIALQVVQPRSTPTPYRWALLDLTELDELSRSSRRRVCLRSASGESPGASALTT